MYTKLDEEGGNEDDNVLDIDLRNIDDDIFEVDFTWLGHLFSADISGMNTWKNVLCVNVDGCKFFKGDIATIESLPEGLKVFSCNDCGGVEGDIVVMAKFKKLKSLGLRETKVKG